MSVEQILIDGTWRDADFEKTFQADNPSDRSALPDVFPVSNWSDIDEALSAAQAAFRELQITPVAQIESFLNLFAQKLDQHAKRICELANLETGLPYSPRLFDVEMPRTVNQLRLAAQAAGEGSWKTATIDTATNIRSYYAAIGPVAVFGPNNFPLAFNGAAGGDFAAAIAAGNPVLVKANPAHPATTRELVKLAAEAAQEIKLPRATVQLIYRTSRPDGLKMVSDPRLGSVGFTGSSTAGKQLKEAADKVGKPIYLEMSSINPVVILPGALEERGSDIAGDFQTSCLMGAGQFCTNPGLVILLESDQSAQFVAAVKEGFASSPSGTLLAKGVEDGLAESIKTITAAGANVEVQASSQTSGGFSSPNTLLSVSGTKFLETPEAFQTEAFGNCSLVVMASDVAQVCQVIEALEGNLTGTIYSDTRGGDDPDYEVIAPCLRQKVGRLINDKMPTGVAVSSAMNHGGPFPATGHPGFTAVGIPASIHRFAMLQSFDNVAENRLPLELKNENPTGRTWRLVDGQWSQKNIS